MNADFFIQRLQKIYTRAAQTIQQTGTVSEQDLSVMAEALEELRVAIEELHVAEEELLQQNDELMLARSQIDEERQRYRDLFEFAPDGYLVTNETGIIREANRAAAKLLNVSPQYLTGKQLINFIPEEDRVTFRAKLCQLSQLDKTTEWELRVAPRKGEPFDAAMTVSTLDRDWKGRPIGWRWLLRDITKRKQAESALRRAKTVEVANQILEREIRERQQLEIALRQSEERYRAISELTSDYTYAYRIEADGTFITELISEAFTRVCGYTLEDLTMCSWHSLIHEEDMPIIIQHGKRLLGGQSDVCEHRIITKRGEVRWVRNYARPVSDGTRKNVLRIYGAAQDITTRKEVEVERSRLLKCEQEARERAEEANQIKDQFLAIVSHELRSPLNAILGWAQLLGEQELDAGTTEKGLKIIERNALLQTKLIEDLLDISRIIRGKLNLQVAQINLVSVIDAALNTMQPAATAKSIQLESKLDPDAGLVLGDAERLQQVIWNLLSNAIKFTPKGGRVEIQLKRIRSQTVICVRDTGIGISSDALPYIFDYFRQADSTSTRSHGGLGLGLAIVRHLIELHSGTVRAESQGEGQGATFTIKLPLILSQKKNSGLPTPEGRRELSPDNLKLKDLRVLVVDDETDTRELLAQILEQAGAQVTATVSVHEALQALEQLQPDVLLSDISMPDKDGYTLIRQVRDLEAKKGGFLPAAALTAFAREEDRQQALSAGFQTHVAKPVEPFKLIKVVANLAEQRLPNKDVEDW